MARSSRLRRFWALILVILLCTVAGTGVGLFVGFLENAPSLDEVNFNPEFTTYIYDINGKTIGHLYRQNRVFVPIEQIPTHVQNAFVAIEDHNFYQHNGIDFVAVGRSILVNIREKRFAQGFSSITQQLARNAFLHNKKQVSRKLQEILWAIQIERKYSKPEILEAYLNIILFGDAAWGIEAASQSYFGKSVEDLTLAEGALLAAIVNRPNSLNPRINMEGAVSRRNLVLSQMHRFGYITAQQAEEAIKEPVILVEKEDKSPLKTEYFINYVRDQLISIYGVDLVYAGGLRVYTTLDLEMQTIAEEVILNSLPEGKEDENGLMQPQGALVAIDPRTGYIKAMVGGRGTDKLNRAVQSPRQPGSAMKPFVYIAALEMGYTPATVYDDRPMQFTLPTGEIYEPRNYNNEYFGPITLRKAIEESVNSVAVQVLDEIGPTAAYEVAKRMGITTLVDKQGELTDKTLAFALGGLTYGTTTMEMASAYGILANQGVWVEPISIVKVVGPNGTDEFTPKRKPVLSEQVSYLMTDMLRGVISRGTGRRGNIGRPAAGKTGTTVNNRDAWFIGYTPELSVAVWLGEDIPKKMTYNGVNYGSWKTTEIWGEFMSLVTKNTPVTDFRKPPGVVEKTIDIKTGLLAHSGIPSTETSVEKFIAGTEPTSYSPRYTWPAQPETPEEPTVEPSEEEAPKKRSPWEEFFNELFRRGN
ncbi:MAG: PBP1A family penicillin-binding protein [Limnochordia bacterium]|nr:PBP1A family penicillin-binding protein [Limnochordia bacterium]MDD2629787.1 PBP1A family penicillin-binding protein [Limnochordia bacterium]MDD4517865.1 PBP1A family penicillin-binding protein [Limnochordia bacterium]